MAHKKYYVVITDIPNHEVNFVESGKNDSTYNGEISCDKEGLVGKWAIYSRTHRGDENGNTTCKMGELHFVDAETFEIVDYLPEEVLAGMKNNYCYLLLGNQEEIELGKESSSNWEIKDGYILTGRKHKGDENAASTVYVKKLDPHRSIFCGNDKKLDLKKEEDYKLENKESNGTEIFMLLDPEQKDKKYYLPITGRNHSGDENGTTTTWFSKYYIEFDDEKI